jgi:hypothetical protein
LLLAMGKISNAKEKLEFVCFDSFENGDLFFVERRLQTRVAF